VDRIGDDVKTRMLPFVCVHEGGNGEGTTARRGDGATSAVHSLSRGQCGAREDAERRRVNTRTKWPRRTCALDVESHSCREMARREPDAARADVWVTSRFQGGFQRYSGLCGGEPRKVAEERCVWGDCCELLVLLQQHKRCVGVPGVGARDGVRVDS
jgi:hypothetical protein